MAQTVFITGGSRGIGAACVRAFAAAGWNVAFTYRENRALAGALAEQTGALALSADLHEVGEQIRIAREGKLKGQPLEDFFHELHN